MADNIVHLVLARLPDAPPGAQGISLFLAPKRLVDDDGSLASPTTCVCASIEHKLGIHGSPDLRHAVRATAARRLIWSASPIAASTHMFTMMNAARLHVGVQGVAIAERAYQQALAYALERKQGRSAWTGDSRRASSTIPTCAAC